MKTLTITKKHALGIAAIATACALSATFANLAHAKSFPDVATAHSQYMATHYLSEKGVVEGYPDGTFGPEKSINRVEALKIILESAGIDVDGIAEEASAFTFPDTDTDAWYAKYISAAIKLGIVQGYPDGTFKPEQTVNTVEALKMAALAYGTNVDEIEAEDSLFDDVEDGVWYSPYVQKGKDENILVVTNNRIGAGDAMTRGSFSEMLFRQMYIKEKGIASYNKEDARADLEARMGLMSESQDTGTGSTMEDENDSGPGSTMDDGTGSGSTMEDSGSGSTMDTGSGTTISGTGAVVEGVMTTEAGVDVRTFTVFSEKFKYIVDGYDNPTFKVQQGETIRIDFKSTDGLHDWVIEGVDNVATDQVNTNNATSIEFTASTTGTFPYYCSVGSHRALGMEGKFVVE